MLKLNAATTALVVIDLQEGILPFAGGPYTANDVVHPRRATGGKVSSQRLARGYGTRRMV
ncbi:putative isochorismatase hydrolase [Salmonella bongori]|nr:putative isochorismatase hydrolase [Salmonella bongori]